MKTPIHPGTVCWAGENPGIYLKDDPTGDWSALGVFFRIVLSPHGRGHTMIVLDQPDSNTGFPESNNLCITDNRDMTKYLIEEFMGKFPSFQGKSGLEGMTYLELDHVFSDGNLKDTYREVVRSGNVEAEMKWENLGEPFVVEVGPQDSATKQHDMDSVFLEASDASISVNGEKFSGGVVDRQFFGKTMSTAFIALAEIWVEPRVQED